MSVDLRHGDMLDELAAMPPASVDSIVTDPPYGLAFMGKGWDHAVPGPDYWTACLRVLKPGGHLLAFGGTRTAHRLAVAVEDAGFEFRDMITWLYGSGFPKSLDVSKAIDKAAGVEREVIGTARAGVSSLQRVSRVEHGYRENLTGCTPDSIDVTAPATDAARQWSGWGTALKPASEPIIVARKPLAGTVAANVQAHGTGALNIDGCRVGTDGGGTSCSNRDEDGKCRGHRNAGRSTSGETFHGPDTNGGRWPTNVVLTHAPDCGPDEAPGECVDGCPVAELDAQSGTLSSRPGAGRKNGHDTAVTTWGLRRADDRPRGHDDSGGASRYFPTFRYQAKAPTAERPKVDGVAHPTVKPLALMRWLVRLVTPPGGLVLDPFAGSGTTGEAATLEGFDAILVEQEAAYLPLIAARLKRVPT